MHKLAKVFSAAVLGVDAYLVQVETHLDGQLPQVAVVGLPDGAVRESRERIAAAIKNAGYSMPLMRITINLAPADIRKEGSSFDLPMAIGILAAGGQIRPERLRRCVLVGELSLDGSLQPARGILPIALMVHKQPDFCLIAPSENAREAAIVEGLTVIACASLSEVVRFLNDDLKIEPSRVDARSLLQSAQPQGVDFRDVRGQEHAKRALEVAAAGGHNVIMIGPPGSGKTMLARRFATILPDLSLDEALESTKIYSVAGLLPGKSALLATRPFRAPHHTISDAGLIGGGKIPRPGEVSLAHHGVLFLDELPEFKKNVLEVLRQPLESGRVHLARAAVSLSYPARFLLIAAMNPCPCGYLNDPRHSCGCAPPQVQKYLNRVSGPLLDRIDIHLEVPAVKTDALLAKGQGENSEGLRKRVISARKIQQNRFAKLRFVHCNAQMPPSEFKRCCLLQKDGRQLIRDAIQNLGLSARAYDRILKVARTVADMDGRVDIMSEHLAEAIQYRSLDRSLANRI